jgi:hypothetical protein
MNIVSRNNDKRRVMSAHQRGPMQTINTQGLISHRNAMQNYHMMNVDSKKSNHNKNTLSMTNTTNFDSQNLTGHLNTLDHSHRKPH